MSAKGPPEKGEHCRNTCVLEAAKLPVKMAGRAFVAATTRTTSLTLAPLAGWKKSMGTLCRCRPVRHQPMPCKPNRPCCADLSVCRVDDDVVDYLAEQQQDVLQ